MNITTGIYWFYVLKSLFDFYNVERFNNISDFHIIIILDRKTAFHTVSYFFDRIFAALQ